MSRVDAAAPIDRLPWLPDEPAPPARRARRPGLLFLAGGLTLGVAAAGFWIGTRSVSPEEVAPRHSSGATTTVRLPEPRAAVPEVRPEVQEQVRFAPPEQVRPASPREVHIAAPRNQQPAKREAARPAEEQEAPAAEKTATNAAVAAVAPAAVPSALPKPWQPRVVKGAAGRLVEIGAFGSVQQAKLGWRYMARAYPAMTHLPAVVRPDRNSKGRVFYRFRVGTTSQAHSEVLCQRMTKIHLSCAVVGLPWKAKVER
jgi:hypothetical protein